MKITLPALTVLIVGAIGMVADGRAQGRSEQALAALATAQHIPNELIVQYRVGVSAQQKSNALGRVGAAFEENVVNGLWRKDGKGDVDLVKLPAGLAIAAAVRQLEADPSVEFAEPNWIYYHNATSNDAYYTNGSLWGMYGASTLPANQFGSGAGVAWAANKTGSTGSSTVYVGIIDEGYMYTHVDLAANAGVNPGEIAGNGIDDDGNGLVDDVYGWDFAGNDNSVFDGSTDDHGTHVAGTIGGVGGNRTGVAGVVWNVKLLSAKFLGRMGGTTANAIKAVNYFTDLKTRKENPVNIVATNNSWGGGGFSQALKAAIDAAGVANILFVAAAGNSGANNDAVASYPSGYSSSNIIAVAAITSTGALASYSNYGATTVDIGAPGSAIWSTVPKSVKGGVASGYASYSGTSMATPHVTGACALYVSLNPGALAAQIKDAILSKVTFTESLSGKTVTHGRLNVGEF
jgi:subtilisin family serine protease